LSQILLCDDDNNEKKLKKIHVNTISMLWYDKLILLYHNTHNFTKHITRLYKFRKWIINIYFLKILIFIL
jgi:hypothetical protein